MQTAGQWPRRLVLLGLSADRDFRMQNTLSTEIQQLVAAQLAKGRFANEQEVLLDALRKQQLWEDEDGLEDDSPAIKEALDEIEAGDKGRPAEEVFAELRKKYSL